MRARGDVLQLAVLGLVHMNPQHGYELRKQLNAMLGPFRAFSYGSLYPCLKSLVEHGLIEEAGEDAAPHALSGKRARIVYQITAEGKERLDDMLSQSGPAAWEDENFDVRFALFSQTDAETRLRILEGRRTRMTERYETLRSSLARTRDKLDAYTMELQRHGLEQVEREVSWLDELITIERANSAREKETGALTAPRSPARSAGAVKKEKKRR